MTLISAKAYLCDGHDCHNIEFQTQEEFEDEVEPNMRAYKVYDAREKRWERRHFCSGHCFEDFKKRYPTAILNRKTVDAA